MGLHVVLKVLGVQQKRLCLEDNQLLLSSLYKKICAYNHLLSYEDYIFIFKGKHLHFNVPGINLIKYGFDKEAINYIYVVQKIIANKSKVDYFLNKLNNDSEETYETEEYTDEDIFDEDSWIMQDRRFLFADYEFSDYPSYSEESFEEEEDNIIPDYLYRHLRSLVRYNYYESDDTSSTSSI